MQFPQSGNQEVKVTITGDEYGTTMVLEPNEIWVGYVYDKSQTIIITVDGDLKNQRVLSLTGINIKKTT